jgi:hypothetical protein
VTYSKGLVVADPSHINKEGQPKEWGPLVRLTDPPLYVYANPRVTESILSVGPCIMLPLALIPNPLGIYSAIKNRKNWDISDEHLQVSLDFRQTNWPYWKNKPLVQFKVRPQEIRLRINRERLLAPASVKASCFGDGSSVGVNADCSPSNDGTYILNVSSTVVEPWTRFDLTFTIPANMINEATLLLGGISRDNVALQTSPIELARKRYVGVGCVLGEGSESHFYTH